MNKNKLIIIALAFVFVLLGFVGVVQAQLIIVPGDEYNPEINPADFTTTITNPYFTLSVGRKLVYEAETPDGRERIEILIPGWTRNVAGVETLVFWDRVFLDGELVEDTRDYLAQHRETGDVWYFGEHVDNYENGVIVDHDGAWLTGEDNAKPGIWVLANPQVGDKFRNEFRVGEAEDESEVLSIQESVTVPYGTFDDCIKHLDGSPLFAAKAHTYYCKEVANTVLEVDLVGPETPVEQIVELVEVDPTGARGIPLPDSYAVEGVVAPPTEGCASSQNTVEISTAKVFVEYNYTDEDIGFHGKFDDGAGWSEICVYAPNGEQVWSFKTKGPMQDQGAGSVFFEAREPHISEVSEADFTMRFPEGQYAVRGIFFDGAVLTGSATFTHDFPAPPIITSPALAEDEESAGDAVVSDTDLEIEWSDVTATISGDPVTITGYEVIIVKVEHDDPNGFSQPVFDVHLPPARNSLTISPEFIESDTVYELEILALEKSGNQTISVGFFKTDVPEDDDDDADEEEDQSAASIGENNNLNAAQNATGHHVMTENSVASDSIAYMPIITH